MFWRGTTPFKTIIIKKAKEKFKNQKCFGEAQPHSKL